MCVLYYAKTASIYTHQNLQYDFHFIFYISIIRDNNVTYSVINHNLDTIYLQHANILADSIFNYVLKNRLKTQSNQTPF